MAKRILSLLTWQTACEEVDSSLIDKVARFYVLEPKMATFFENHNPWALEEISRSLLKTETRGLWSPDPELLTQLKESYLVLVGVMAEKDALAANENKDNNSLNKAPGAWPEPSKLTKISKNRQIDPQKKRRNVDLDKLLEGDQEANIIEVALDEILLEENLEDSLVKADPEDSLLEDKPKDSLVKADPEVSLLENNQEDSLFEDDPETSLLKDYPEVCLLKADQEESLLDDDPETSLLKDYPEVCLLEADPETSLLEDQMEIQCP
jgi:hypothetical protein